MEYTQTEYIKPYIRVSYADNIGTYAKRGMEQKIQEGCSDLYIYSAFYFRCGYMCAYKEFCR